MYNAQTAVNHILLLAGAAGAAQVCRGRHSQLWGVPEGGSGEEKEIQSMRTRRELVTCLLGRFFLLLTTVFSFSLLQIDDQRRTHNYDEFICTFISMLAQEGKRLSFFFPLSFHWSPLLNCLLMCSGKSLLTTPILSFCLGWYNWD